MSHNSPFQTPLAHFLPQLIPTLLRFLKWTIISLGKFIRDILFFCCCPLEPGADILSKFRFQTSSNTSSSIHTKLAASDPKSSAQVRAVLWILETSTDPVMVTAAADIAIDLQWRHSDRHDSSGIGFRTGPPAGTRRPTRTRQYRTRPTRGFKPVRVPRGSLIYPRFPGKTADQHFVYAAYRNAAAIWHGTLFSRPHKAGTASAERRPRLPSTRGFTRAGPRYCGGSEISTRTRTRQTLGSKPANGPDTRAEP
ncbi:hypothetical protein DFH09DRAFT_1111051 [Mycena vulgaris]|nr:hypothetical protein DFH09DRAFT_1111051 [Mycena vulgaris]